MRAWDMFPQYYTRQFGWGQWVDDTESVMVTEGKPCQRSPRRMACRDKAFPDVPGEDLSLIKDCTWPEGDPRLLNCAYEICAETEQPVYGIFEGGMGYWPYMTRHSGVKWLIPAAVSGDYFDNFGGTFLNDFHQPCTHMGGNVQVANTLLWTADAYSFEKGPDGFTDGMVGYMMQRTPIGKMHPNDTRSYWTLIIDTATWAGPISYSSAFFYEHPNSWHPEVKTLSDPSVKVGFVQLGVEGELASTAVEEDGFYWIRIQDVQFPQDVSSPETFTWTSGHADYPSDWANSVLEPILDGSNTRATPGDIRQAAAAARRKPSCSPRPGASVCFWSSFNSIFPHSLVTG